MRQLLFLFTIFCLFLLSGCQSRPKSTTAFTREVYTPMYAKGFDIMGAENMQIRSFTCAIHGNCLLYTSWQASVLWTPMAWATINGQYMFEHNDSRNVSTWSAGTVLYPFGKELQIKGSMAYNYRFPSMNDLYWRPGGNPEVKPEKGYSCLLYTSRCV